MQPKQQQQGAFSVTVKGEAGNTLFPNTQMLFDDTRTGCAVFLTDTCVTLKFTGHCGEKAGRNFWSFKIKAPNSKSFKVGTFSGEKTSSADDNHRHYFVVRRGDDCPTTQYSELMITSLETKKGKLVHLKFRSVVRFNAPGAPPATIDCEYTAA